MNQVELLETLEDMSVRMGHLDIEATALQTPSLAWVILTEMPNKKQTVITDTFEYVQWLGIWENPLTP